MQFEKIQRLLKWGERFGVEIPSGIRFEYDEIEGFRCICTDQIESPTLTIPAELIIRKELISSVFPDIQYKVADSNTYLKFLLAKLKYDSGDGQIKELREKFEPYLDCLPAVVDSPLVWNPVELSLLEGTNLGNSLRDKLHVIWKEWFTIIQECAVFDKSAVQRDLQLYQDYYETPIETIYETIVKDTVNQTSPVWYSFSAFLWSHLIFLSRAFPQYVIDNDCERHQVMLLPIIDILNHDYRCKVEWSSDGSNFFYKHLGSAAKGTQLYNNYGAKGNEELLSGYGFVLDDNICSSVALKIKLPLDSIAEIQANEPGIQLLTLEDYTTFAFEKGPEGDEHQAGKTADAIFREGVTYLICKNNKASLESMLGLFAYLNKAGQESWRGLAPRFRGLQSLRLALDQKLQQVDVKGRETQENRDYPIDNQRKNNALAYRAEQVSILKWALSELKSMEKQWLSENKTGLLTTKKIMKYDPNFVDEELPVFFGDNVRDYLALLTSHQFLVLWVLVKLYNKSFGSKYSWVAENFDEFTKLDQDSKSIVDDPEVFSFQSAVLNKSCARLDISVQEVKAVYQFLARNSFTRFASRDQETILVRSGL